LEKDYQLIQVLLLQLDIWI